jgi:sn-glycerol 3-phosphate transport system ATP-binding protein
MVEVGVRPEEMTVAPAGTSGGIEVTPEFIEELGPNRLVHGLAGSASLVRSVPSSAREIESGPIKLQIPEHRVPVFDMATGRALRG